jgi:hypothetical protein
MMSEPLFVELEAVLGFAESVRAISEECRSSVLPDDVRGMLVLGAPSVFMEVSSVLATLREGVALGGEHVAGCWSRWRWMSWLRIGWRWGDRNGGGVVGSVDGVDVLVGQVAGWRAVVVERLDRVRALVDSCGSYWSGPRPAVAQQVAVDWLVVMVPLADRLSGLERVLVACVEKARSTGWQLRQTLACCGGGVGAGAIVPVGS